MADLVHLDGSRGEGGGQILRTALALSLATGRPFRIERIRAGRKKPGLLRQHLTGVRLAAAVGEARVEGDELGSTTLVFEPSACRAGTHQVRVGTAGSTSLVAQAVLPALLFAEGPTELVIEGGTHAPSAPPFEFLERAWARLLADHGARVELRLERPGFFPAGGGRVHVRVEPWREPRPMRLLERGERVSAEAVAILSRVPHHVAERELARVQVLLGWPEDRLRVEVRPHSPGPGNALVLAIEHEHVTEVFVAFGARGVRAEQVADQACSAAKAWIAAAAPVGVHLADQLMLPLALGAGGTYRTTGLSRHSRTNVEVIDAFLPGAVTTAAAEGGGYDVTVRGRIGG